MSSTPVEFQPGPGTGKEIDPSAGPVDFHLHFEGCLFASTLERIAGKEVAGGLAFKPGLGFAAFLHCLKGQLSLLRDEKSFGFALDGFVDYLHRQKLSSCEFFFSPLIYDKSGLGAEYALAQFAARAAELPSGTVMLFDTVRQFGPGAAEKVVELAEEWRGRLPIGGFGMGGDEQSLPAREFRPAFDEARKLGLGLTCHAGETGGARPVWEALDQLGVSRIGHGLGAAEDAALLKRMASDGIAIECSPASNLAIGLVKSLAEHPLHLFQRAGLDLLPGADDPALFEADSRAQFDLLAGICGAERLLANGLRHGFARIQHATN